MLRKTVCYGKKIKVYKIFNIIEDFDTFEYPRKYSVKIFVLINNLQKKISSLKSFSIIEIWNFKKNLHSNRQGFLFFSIEDIIWGMRILKFSDFPEKKYIVTLNGFELQFYQIPEINPIFWKIISFSLKVSFFKNFQWKIFYFQPIFFSCNLNGKIMISQINNLSNWNQLIHSDDNRAPVTAIYYNNTYSSKTKIIFTGGYDGIVKIWKITYNISCVIKIILHKSRITELNFLKLNDHDCYIFSSFDDGCIAYNYFDKNFQTLITNFINHYQSTYTEIIENMIIAVGDEGSISIKEVASPYNEVFLNYNSLNILKINKFNIKSMKKNLFLRKTLQRYSLKSHFFFKLYKLNYHIIVSNNGIFILFR
ncbi:hypothetical protein (nucleomorph) [Guillardia theta]|nr:hypothetical protein GTHECHR1121 [Guillardia theta]AAK39914.1 hypothetical protein [Guillardia theta]